MLQLLSQNELSRLLVKELLLLLLLMELLYYSCLHAVFSNLSDMGLRLIL